MSLRTRPDGARLPPRNGKRIVGAYPAILKRAKAWQTLWLEIASEC